MRHVLAAVVLLLAACGADSTATTTTDPSPPPPAITTRPLPTEPPTTDAVPATSSTVPDLEPRREDVTGRPATTIPLPGDAFIEGVDVSAGGVLAYGYVMQEDTGEVARPMLWFSDDQTTWRGQSLIDLYPNREAWEVPTVTDVAQFDGRRYAFLMGDESVSATEPSMLVSVDGAPWEVTSLTARAGVRAVAYTPESPPYPGASAVTAAAFYENHLIVTGWTRTSDGTAAALWRSPDGVRWDFQVLPNVAFPNEWGSGVSVGTHGYLVTLGGPVHSGAGALYSPDGETWTTVDQVGDRAASAVGQNESFAYLLRFDIFGTGKADLLLTEDGETWQPSPPIPVPEPSIGSLASGERWDPVAFSSWGSADTWVFDRGEWIMRTITQVDRLITITDDHYIGETAGNLVILDRRAP